MNFKEYFCTSLVIVNLAISASSTPIQNNVFHDKKNKEVKVSFSQEEVVASQANVLPSISLTDRITALDLLILLSLSLGLFCAIQSLKNKRHSLKKIQLQTTSYILNCLPSVKRPENKQKKLFHSGIHTFNQILP